MRMSEGEFEDEGKKKEDRSGRKSEYGCNINITGIYASASRYFLVAIICGIFLR